VKELLLEKDRETWRVEQNRDFTVQQYQKRLKVLEMRIDDLENVSLKSLWLARTNHASGKHIVRILCSKAP